MKTKEISIITLRVLGIYCLIQSLLAMRYPMYTLATWGESSESRLLIFISDIFPVFSLLISALLLIVFARTISIWIVSQPQSHPEQSQSERNNTDIQPILFSVVGVFIFLHAIPATFKWISQLFNVMSIGTNYPYDQKIVNDSWVSFILSVIQFALAIGLFVGGRKLSLFWQSLRHWPREREE